MSTTLHANMNLMIKRTGIHKIRHHHCRYINQIHTKKQFINYINIDKTSYLNIDTTSYSNIDTASYSNTYTASYSNIDTTNYSNVANQEPNDLVIIEMCTLTTDSLMKDLKSKRIGEIVTLKRGRHTEIPKDKITGSQMGQLHDSH